MEAKRLLLLSNSTNFGENYLEYSMPAIRQFLGAELSNVLFIPYAGVGISYDLYTQKVADSFSAPGYKVSGIHTTADPINAIAEADALVIGGGNTFELLNQLYLRELVEPIQKKVMNGLPFVGWSAGSNIAGPSIKTTNDMPIVQPPSFKALSLVPFQINPHYTEERLPNHGGETRVDRINEFISLNPNTYVVGIPEGNIIEVIRSKVRLIGPGVIRVFKKGQEIKAYTSSDDLDFLVD